MNNQGFKVQGKPADKEGSIPEDVVIGDISLSIFKQVPAQATTSVSLAGNLTAAAPLLGTVTRTPQLLATAAATEDLSGLFANGRAESFLQLTSGLDTLTIGDQTVTESFIYGVDFTTLQQLADAINATTQFADRFTAAVGTNGQITFTSETNNITLVAGSNTNSILDAAFEGVDGAVLLNAGDTIDADEFAHIATGTDSLIVLRNSQGNLLDLQEGDDITLLGAAIGGTTLSTVPVSLVPDINGTTLETLRGVIQTNLFGSDPQPEEEVVLDNGRIVVNGGLGTDRAVTGINVGAGVSPNEDTRSLFSASMAFVEEQAAKDVTQTATTTVFDKLGQGHTLRVIFKKTREPGKWNWTADLTGNEFVRTGGSGNIRLSRDGSLRLFEFDAGATSFSFDPGNNSDPVDIRFDVGAEGEFDGITQFAAPSSAVFVAQDGFPLGSLETININEQGLLSANFSNGIRKTVAQITLAQFNNPTGLTKVQDTMFIESVNSGSAIIGDPGKTVQAEIASRHLEQSNVDLAEEFTRLITAQRGFQANSRVITTSSDVLAELVNLKQ